MGTFPVYNVKEAPYNAAGDGTTDDTTAIQDAIDDMDTVRDKALLYFPPGVYRITDTLEFGGLSGYNIQGSGSLVDAIPGWYGLSMGAVIKWGAEDDTLPMINFDGSGAFVVRDLALDGVDVAKYGIRVQGRSGLAGSLGLFENVRVFQCDVGVNFGNGGDEVLSSDCTFVRCGIGNCRIGCQTSHLQAVNQAFHSCAMFNIDESCFDLVAINLYASMFEVENVNRITMIRSGGTNMGHVTFRNLRIDYNDPRTIIHEIDSSADEVDSRASYEDVHINADTPGNTSDARARFILKGFHTCVLRGGKNLCGDMGFPVADNGRLVTMSDSSGFLVDGAWLPNDPTKVLGTISGSAKYRVRNCFDQAGVVPFITDYSN